ncbi:MAG: hypothetical protein MJB57_05540 [Gemmatimonadetes bacterium]|nr:hypothetical protein [Gemmatimonadota bacterium]
MDPKLHTKWVLANALGTSSGFVAALQAGMFVQFGFDMDLHWQFEQFDNNLRFAVADVVVLSVLGTVLGGVQALQLRTRSVRISSWIIATATGFGLMAAVSLPLTAVGVWGRIPGPVEPIVTLVGGGTVAGFLQRRALHRQGIEPRSWLALWITGLVASLVPIAALLALLESLGVSVSWAAESFITGLLLGGVAAWISGKALLVSLPE